MLTKEDWSNVEQALKGFWSQVELAIDGYQVTLQLQRIGTYKNAIVLYINGELRSEWLMTDCEERRRFLHCRE